MSPAPEKKKIGPLYRIIKWLVRVFYIKYEVEGVENLPDEACIVVGNHTQMHGPLASELYFPGRSYTWCAGEMMHLKEVPGYAFADFWSQKSKYTHPFYRLLSYLIAPLAVCIFNNANTIGVYRDGRIISTFRETVKRLNEGANVVIFPEHDVKYNNIVYEFQEGFVESPDCITNGAEKNWRLSLAACGLFPGHRLGVDKGKSCTPGMERIRGLCRGDDLPVHHVHQAALCSGFLCGNTGLPACRGDCLQRPLV